jgi:beta-lactamase class A
MNGWHVDVTSELRVMFDGAGVRGWAHARRVDETDDGDSTGLDPDEPVAIASLYKLLVAVAWAELADGGELDPMSRLVMSTDRRTPGPTGVSTLLDDVEVSARDAVRLMLSLSDNAAADRVLELVGVDAVQAAVLRWGLRRTVVRRGTAESQLQVQRDTATSDPLSALDALTDLDHDVRTAEYDPARASTSTARARTTVLGRLWTGRLAPGPSGDVVRAAMTRQVFRHRLASGFPHDDVVTAGKTGTLGILRHEVGVVCFPQEVPVAVAVLTRAARPERHLPAVDAVIGAVGRHAVGPLRRPMATDA